jgi:type III secretion control protein HpaP
MSIQHLDLQPVRILPRQLSPAAPAIRTGRQRQLSQNFSACYNQAGANGDIRNDTNDAEQCETDGAAAASGPNPDAPGSGADADTDACSHAEQSGCQPALQAETQSEPPPGLPPEQAYTSPSSQSWLRPASPSAASDAIGIAAATAGSSIAKNATALSTRIARACIRDEEGSLMSEHLAAVVAQFCNSPSICTGGMWELQVDINPKILAETQLRLQLSSFRLSLRFETSDQRSKLLIYENSKELSSRLDALLQGKIDVEVIFW